MVSQTYQDERPDRISVGFRSRWLNDERLRYMSQIGVEDVFVDVLSPGYEADAFPDDIATEGARHLELSPDSVPSVERFVELKELFADFDLRFAGIHSLHYGMYGDIMFDREGRDRQINAIAMLIERLGEAGIATLGYQWNPRGVVPMRTETDAKVRGGATATRWNEADMEEIETPPGELERTYSEAECWENYEGFLEQILPVAEEAGVEMALHPADPPVYEEIGGVPRLFRNAEAFERAMSAVPSESHGLKLCLGCFSEMGEDIPTVIRRFGDDIVFVHFRDVVGTVPDFTETFLDEGNFDPHEAMAALHEVGFTGPVLLDHVPHVEGDTEWRHRSRAYGAGYFRCLIESVTRP
jgi:mannonate dehydratase